MRISDWSSDVCSSDLLFGARDRRLHRREFGHLGAVERSVDRKAQPRDRPRHDLEFKAIAFRRADVGSELDRIRHAEIGRASWRERVCKSAKISVVAV